MSFIIIPMTNNLISIQHHFNRMIFTKTWMIDKLVPMGPPPGPPGQGSQAGAPTAPPPSFVPAETQQVGAFAVDPGSIRGCLFRYTYVWLRNRQQFWYFPTFVGRTSVSGWRWNGFSWVFFGVSLRQIQSFTCV